MLFFKDKKETPPTEQEELKCPVSPETRKIWLEQHSNSIPFNHKELIKEQKALECSSENLNQNAIDPFSNSDDIVQLPSERIISSIPKTGTQNNWIYPSEKQFYDAMVRKNWSPNPNDMKVVVPIHNSVNERVWNFIKLWENSNTNLRLSNFKGDASKLTPRAWIRYNLLGLSKPFDRHDWTINSNGKQFDYVIDFYSDDKNTSGIYLDVRPKLNSFHGFKLRILKSLGL